MFLKHFFQLIRWKNIVLIAIMQFLIKYYFLSTFQFETSLSYITFLLLITSTVLITSGGYIINDIYDIKTDLINKPKKVIIQKHFSKSIAIKLYHIINITGILCGVLLSIKIQKPLYSIYFIAISIILYTYSKYLKGKILIGNITVSFLLAFSILIVLVFDTPWPINLDQVNQVIKIQHVIILYSIFAFLINFIREIVKDIEDINGDFNQRLTTYPIVFGRKRTKKLAMLLCFITLFIFLFVVFNYISIDSLAFAYLFILIFIPLLYFCFKLYNAKTNLEYSHLSKVLKVIILTGVLSIPLISNHFNNAI